MKTQKYVVGFMFDATMCNVALIRKQKPEWQKGLLNGIGGKIEEGELPSVAMAREFMEEAGLSVPWPAWSRLCAMSGTNNDGGSFSVDFFFTIGKPHKLTSMESEQIEVVPVADVAGFKEKTVGNVPWLVALAVDCGKGVYPPSAVTAIYDARKSI